MKEFIQEDTIREMGIDDDEQLNAICDQLEEEFNQIKQDREDLRSSILIDGEDGIHLPVNIPRLIWNCKEVFQINPRGKSDLNP